MEVTLKSTEKVVQIVINGEEVPARIWVGHSAGGVKCHAFITRIACCANYDTTEFEQELQQHDPPSPDIQHYDLRYIL